MKKYKFKAKIEAGDGGGAYVPLPLASALDLESGETVTWKVLDRTHLLLVRLPERKQLQGEAVPQPPARKREQRAGEQRP